jgi:hypothetical protein
MLRKVKKVVIIADNRGGMTNFSDNDNSYTPCSRRDSSGKAAGLARPAAEKLPPQRKATGSHKDVGPVSRKKRTYPVWMILKTIKELRRRIRDRKREQKIGAWTNERGNRQLRQWAEDLATLEMKLARMRAKKEEPDAV